MNIKSLIYICVFPLLNSCNGQATKPNIVKAKEVPLAVVADTVTTFDNNVMLVYNDMKNNYWFGSWENGLYQYNGKFILHYSLKNGLPSNRVDEIKEDQNGNVYFNTGNQIVKFDGNHFRIITPSTQYSTWQLAPTDLWFKLGWNQGFVYRYDGNQLYKLQIPKNKLGEEYIQKNPTNASPYVVYSIYKDSKGAIWFGTGSIGAVRFNGKNFDWIVERDVVEIFNDENEGSNGVRSIIEDKNGDFWFNSAYRYSVYNKPLNTDLFYNRIKSIGNLDGVATSNLYEYLSSAKDNQHNLWIATYDAGVWQYNGKETVHYPIVIDGKQIKLFSIYTDRQGTLWLGTPNNGVLKFNGKTFEQFKP